MDQTEATLTDRQSMGKGDYPDWNVDLVVIGEQTRETVALLRQLIELLLPKADPDKPKLEDLIAALVGQQATTIILCQQISTDLQNVLACLSSQGVKPNGLSGAKEVLRS